jgi:hypothetical protein
MHIPPQPGLPEFGSTQPAAFAEPAEPPGLRSTMRRSLSSSCACRSALNGCLASAVFFIASYEAGANRDKMKSFLPDDYNSRNKQGHIPSQPGLPGFWSTQPAALAELAEPPGLCSTMRRSLSSSCACRSALNGCFAGAALFIAYEAGANHDKTKSFLPENSRIENQGLSKSTYRRSQLCLNSGALSLRLLPGLQSCPPALYHAAVPLQELQLTLRCQRPPRGWCVALTSISRPCKDLPD